MKTTAIISLAMTVAFAGFACDDRDQRVYVHHEPRPVAAETEVVFVSQPADVYVDEADETQIVILSDADAEAIELTVTDETIESLQQESRELEAVLVVAEDRLDVALAELALARQRAVDAEDQVAVEVFVLDREETLLRWVSTSVEFFFITTAESHHHRPRKALWRRLQRARQRIRLLQERNRRQRQLYHQRLAARRRHAKRRAAAPARARRPVVRAKTPPQHRPRRVMAPVRKTPAIIAPKPRVIARKTEPRRARTTPRPASRKPAVKIPPAARVNTQAKAKAVEVRSQRGERQVRARQEKLAVKRANTARLAEQRKAAAAQAKAKAVEVRSQRAERQASARQEKLIVKRANTARLVAQRAERAATAQAKAQRARELRQEKRRQRQAGRKVVNAG